MSDLKNKNISYQQDGTKAPNCDKKKRKEVKSNDNTVFDR